MSGERTIMHSDSAGGRGAARTLAAAVAFLLWLIAPVAGATTPALTGLSLTPAERSWLAEHPLIRLAPDPDFPPIEFIGDKGHYRGIAADYARLVEQRLGIRFEIVRLKSWDEVLDDLAHDEHDAGNQRQVAAQFLENRGELGDNVNEQQNQRARSQHQQEDRVNEGRNDTVLEVPRSRQVVRQAAQRHVQSAADFTGACRTAGKQDTDDR